MIDSIDSEQRANSTSELEKKERNYIPIRRIKEPRLVTIGKRMGICRPRGSRGSKRRNR